MNAADVFVGAPQSVFEQQTVMQQSVESLVRLLESYRGRDKVVSTGLQGMSPVLSAGCTLKQEFFYIHVPFFCATLFKKCCIFTESFNRWTFRRVLISIYIDNQLTFLTKHSNISSFQGL